MRRFPIVLVALAAFAGAAVSVARAGGPLAASPLPPVPIDWWEQGAQTYTLPGATEPISGHGADAVAVWARSKGAGVVVADIDTGVDPTQLGLKGALLPGRDFSHAANGTLDTNGHGTGVAGLIAGRGGQPWLPSGIASQAKVLPLKVGDRTWPKDGYIHPKELDPAQIVAALRYAASRSDVRVINLSLSGSWRLPSLRAAVAFAQAQGKLIVAAAGNSWTDDDQKPAYPCAYPGVLCVAASDRGDALPFWTSFGAHTVALAAPGDLITIYRRKGGTAHASGTSCAAPIVAGVAALLMAAHPDATAAQVRAAIIASVVPAPAFAGKVASGGIVDAAAALALLDARS